MPAYLWEGTNRRNEVQKGEMEAPNEQAVRAQLGRQRINPTKIKKKPKDLFENVSFMQPKVTEKDVILFARQFSTMIDAGLPIIQCLDILYTQQENKTFKNVVKDVKESVEGGSTLAEALGKFEAYFCTETLTNTITDHLEKGDYSEELEINGTVYTVTMKKI